jgi:hypothetical protein
MKQVLGWGTLLLVIFYIGTNPDPASELASNIGSGIAELFTNIGDFLVELSR